MAAGGDKTEELSAALLKAKGSAEEEDAVCADLRRTVTVEGFCEAGATIWTFKELSPPEANKDSEAPPDPPPNAKAAAKAGAAKGKAAPAPADKAAAKGKAAPDKGAKGKAAKDAAPDTNTKPVEPFIPEPDRAGGGIFFSHTWDAPDNWQEHFAVQSYVDVKTSQATSAINRVLSQKDLVKADPPRLWLDLAGLPTAVAPADHPLDQTVFGPCVLPLTELKRMAEQAQSMETWFSVIRLDAGYSYKGTMQFKRYDAKGRPIVHTTPFEVEWALPPGHYYVKTARVLSQLKGPLLRSVMKEGWLPEDLQGQQLSPMELQQEMQRRLEAIEDMKLVQAGLTPEEASKKEAFQGKGQLLKSWFQKLTLKEEVWLEVTLGTVRSLCLIHAEKLLTSHSCFIALAAWNYFDRLWPLCEWAMFCCQCGPDAIQLGCDMFIGRTITEYHRALRRLSVTAAQCRDPRDRDLLYGLLASIFRCTAEKAVTFEKKKGDQLTRAVHALALDFAPLERYIRATAIAIFAHETALASKCELGVSDEHGWAALAAELGLQELHAGLKKSKPWDWMKASKVAAEEAAAAAAAADAAAAAEAAAAQAALAESQEDGQAGAAAQQQPPPQEEDPEAKAAAEAKKAAAIEDGYQERVQSWWTRHMLPVLDKERKLAMKPGKGMK